ncbi:MAG: AAA family ATPase [Crocinitomicaceae bacterium]|nr:AAA family ATPase [Crocinitomicaceae bacterium]
MNTNYVGTRWHKCDLHLHTPASLCFRDRESVTADQWVQEAIDKGLSCVAITDHNTGEWIDKIKEVAEGTSLTVFPGVEITCSDAKVHLLILFDVDKTTQDVEDFLVSCEIKRDMFGQQEAHSPRTSLQVTAIASSYEAIVIPAHIDEFNGLCEIAHEPRKNLLNKSEIRSVQVVHKEFTLNDGEYNRIDQNEFVSKLNTYYGRTEKDIQKGRGIQIDRVRTWRQATKQSIEYNKAILTFSDNPHQTNDSQHGLWGIGRRFTWIKMDARPCLEGIRQALLVPEARVINDFCIEDGESPYSFPDTWIEKICFENTVITEPEKTINVDFSPQMTNIVGGRGSGKSSVLGFMRGLFPKYHEELEDLPAIKTDFDSFFRQASGNDAKGVLSPSSNIEIILNRRNNKYRIILNQTENGGQPQTSRFNTLSGEWENEEDAGFIDLFEMDIFSQKQVFEIANRPNALRNKIDNDIEGVAELKQQLREHKAFFLEHTAHIRNLQVRISEKERLETEIRDIQTRLDALDIATLKEQLQSRQKFASEESEIENFKNDLSTQINELESALNEFSFPTTIPSIATEGDYVENINPLIEELQAKFREIKSTLTSKIEEGKASLNNFENAIEETNWANDKTESKRLYDAQQEQLQSDGLQDLADPQEIEREIENVQRKQQQIHEIELLEQDLVEALEKKERLKEEFFQLRAQLTRERRNFLQRLLTGNVRAKVIPCGDIDYFEAMLRNIMNAQGTYNSDFVALRERWNPQRQPLENNVSINRIFEEIQADNYTGELSGFFVNKVKGLGLPQMDELDLLLPEDKIVVEYKSNERSGFRPIATASPGQKTAAILTFLLSHGNRPLIIDQPEDDLDTSLIHSLVVQQLRESKQKRQVIIVTHNPNIPVNGDSEYVVVMNSETKYIEPKHAGSIDDLTIRKLICDVMEGGLEAFNLRSQRYKLS